MSSVHGHQFPLAAERGLSIEELVRRVAQTANGALNGETNNVLHVTLEPGVAFTEVGEPRVKPGTVVLLVPESESAAAAIASVYSVASTGLITIHHNSDPATDRTFGVVFFGAGAA